MAEALRTEEKDVYKTAVSKWLLSASDLQVKTANLLTFIQLRPMELAVLENRVHLEILIASVIL